MLPRISDRDRPWTITPVDCRCIVGIFSGKGATNHPAEAIELDNVALIRGLPRLERITLVPRTAFRVVSGDLLHPGGLFNGRDGSAKTIQCRRDRTAPGRYRTLDNAIGSFVTDLGRIAVARGRRLRQPGKRVVLIHRRPTGGCL
jgi:hypothetical protein